MILSPSMTRTGCSMGAAPVPSISLSARMRMVMECTSRVLRYAVSARAPRSRRQRGGPEILEPTARISQSRELLGGHHQVDILVNRQHDGLVENELLHLL